MPGPDWQLHQTAIFPPVGRTGKVLKSVVQAGPQLLPVQVGLELTTDDRQSGELLHTPPKQEHLMMTILARAGALSQIWRKAGW